MTGHAILLSMAIGATDGSYCATLDHNLGLASWILREEQFTDEEDDGYCSETIQILSSAGS